MVVVTVYDSESGHPGSNPEWGYIYYKASITASQLNCMQRPCDWVGGRSISESYI